MTPPNKAPSATLMITACIASASAWSRRPRPSARAIADEMPPPMAPAETICISMTPGKTSAMPASASVPSFDTNQVSINPVAACATMTSTLGHAIRNRVGTMGPCSKTRVRGLSSAGATTAASRGPRSTVAPSAATLILRSSLARGGTGDERVIGRIDGPPRGRVHQHRIHGAAGLGVDEQHARALGREVPVAPGQQREQHRAEIASTRGQQVLVARRLFAVTAAAEEPGVDQRIEPSREHVRGDAETFLELIKARHPVQGVAQNEHAPPFAHACEAAGDWARHGLEALVLH